MTLTGRTLTCSEGQEEDVSALPWLTTPTTRVRISLSPLVRHYTVSNEAKIKGIFKEEYVSKRHEGHTA